VAVPAHGWPALWSDGSAVAAVATNPNARTIVGAVAMSALHSMMILLTVPSLEDTRCRLSKTLGLSAEHFGQIVLENQI
jgi:hypothetical protein